ncbi:MAG: exo-alpha-sialidase [Pirellulales bacterium]|nr:exo-alpha-sialidase [Pirellulales bacterium]
MTIQDGRFAHLLAMLLWSCCSIGLCNAAAWAEEPVEQTDVFVGGTEGYHSYRIPAVVLVGDHTLLAFCEGRKNGRGDTGDIDLMLRRSTDGGKTWQPMQLVYEEGDTAKITIGNPCPVVDRTSGTIWLPFCRNNDRVLVTHSTDDGRTWASPVEITPDVKQPDWGWYATGPGHGIQLRSGRLVVPCDHRAKSEIQDRAWKLGGRSHVVYSDDHGKTWRLGGVTAPRMNECEVVELADKSLLLSMRNHFGNSLRAFASSTDGGMTWSTPEHHQQVYCPTCQSSLHRYTLDPKPRILYSGPGGPGRNRMTIRLSSDEGKTWPVAKVLYEGSAAYSDLVVLPDGTIGCLYERDDYGKITFARFTVAWLSGIE